MILTLAWKTLVSHPVRAAVLGIGFGLGVAVMATLLGVGEVVLDQARAPALVGGGQLMATTVTGPITSARFALMTIGGLSRGVAAAPRKRADLYLVRGGKTIAVRAKGGIPSLERAIGDPETAGQNAWVDTPADRRWADPDPAEILRAMDRFHPIPDVPARADSWAEWLYFKGYTRTGIQFYCTFLAGPMRPDGRRSAGVRLQLDRRGTVTMYSASEAVDSDAIVASAPDLAIGSSRVRLDGMRYHVTLDLPGARGEFFIDAVRGRSLPPIEIRGGGGWISGYTVPVMSGALHGSIVADGAEISLDGSGYHDHNWGFWKDVSWRWGQVQYEGLSYLYGRVFPPADAADPERVPGFLVALGPDGPVGYTTRVRIDETDDPVLRRPTRIVVSGRGASIDLTLDIAIENAIVTRGGALAAGPDFLQLRGRYHVTGRAGGRELDFEAAGAAETFRGRP